MYIIGVPNDHAITLGMTVGELVVETLNDLSAIVYEVYLKFSMTCDFKAGAILLSNEAQW